MERWQIIRVVDVRRKKGGKILDSILINMQRLLHKKHDEKSGRSNQQVRYHAIDCNSSNFPFWALLPRKVMTCTCLKANGR